MVVLKSSSWSRADGWKNNFHKVLYSGRVTFLGTVVTLSLRYLTTTLVASEESLEGNAVIKASGVDDVSSVRGKVQFRRPDAAGTRNDSNSKRLYHFNRRIRFVWCASYKYSPKCCMRSCRPPQVRGQMRIRSFGPSSSLDSSFWSGNLARISACHLIYSSNHCGNSKSEERCDEADVAFTTCWETGGS